MSSAKREEWIPLLSNDTIRAKADETRRTCFGERFLFPFDVDEMAENLGLKIIPIPNLVSEFNIDGFLNYVDREIAVDEDDYDNAKERFRLRFTIAHEIGHYVLHNEFFSKVNLSTKEEWSKFYLRIDGHDILEKQADEFAGRFLVPKEHLQLMITQEKSKVSLTGTELVSVLAVRIAHKLRVNVDVIKIRFQKEKLLPLIRARG